MIFRNKGWILDVYEDYLHGMVLWFVTTKGDRIKLYQPFKTIFYVGGSNTDLRSLWKYLQFHSQNPQLSKQTKKDIFLNKHIDVLAVEAETTKLSKIFHEVSERFNTLQFYDADISATVRYAAAYGVFPLCSCEIEHDEEGRIYEIHVLDTRWELDPVLPKLKIMEIEPDCDPSREKPINLFVKIDGKQMKVITSSPRPLLIIIQSLIKRYDPDILLTKWGDTWLLPWLDKLAEENNINIDINRDVMRNYASKPEKSYFSYGQIVFTGQHVHLFGRLHIDKTNSHLWKDLGLEGTLEMARVTTLPIQQAARSSPGTGISTMQILTAMENEILTPWHKQQAEKPKTALELIESDFGGLIYQPIVGIHRDVGEIDFVSMYPSIMVRRNISPETKKPELLERSEEPPGLIPMTLEPLLRKRVALKTRLANFSSRDPQKEKDKARSSAQKWLLVTCFGYLGYKNARFGRIEAHEAVTAGGREALLRAKEVAEDAGFTVLHMYVDGLWVQKSGKSKTNDFEPMLEEISEKTGLAISLDGIFRWVAFLPSRVDGKSPVPNRYFGVFQDGSIKVRGLEARRRDTAPWISEMQTNLLEHLALAESLDELPRYIPGALKIFKNEVDKLLSGEICPEDLVMKYRVTRRPEEYKVMTAGARAAKQLIDEGKEVKPGQRVSLLFVNGGNVRAWKSNDTFSPMIIDKNHYRELAVRAAGSVFQPFGIKEEDLMAWTKGGIQIPLKYPNTRGQKRYLINQYADSPGLIRALC